MNPITKAWHRLEWQQQHFQPSIEKTDEEHVCAFCGEQYCGNFCPQCGLQYGRDRFTWKTVALNLMDLWGVGRRNVFSTIGHLLWRPGYLMHDYLRSKHRAYFPPIPLLVATCLLFSLMINVLHIGWSEDFDSAYDFHEVVESEQQKRQQDGSATQDIDLEVKLAFEHQLLSLEHILKVERQWSRDHIEYSLVLSNILIILLAGWIFHRSPRINLTMVESFYVQMYISCQMMLIAIPVTLITWCVHESGVLPYLLPSVLAFVILVIDYYQLCGFSLWGTVWRVSVMALANLLALVSLGITFGVLYLMFPVIQEIIAG